MDLLERHPILVFPALLLGGLIGGMALYFGGLVVTAIVLWLQGNLGFGT